MILKSEDVKYIVVHCSATPPHSDWGVYEINELHQARGWSGCGYHYVVRRDGAVEGGRPLSQVGAHVYGYNKVSIGICLVGGTNSRGQAENNFTPKQFASLHAMLATLSHAFPSAEILGHRDLSPDIDGDGIIESWEWLKQCPCFDVREWWQSAQKWFA